MERLTEKHYAEKGYYMKCSETCEKSNCDTCDSMADIVDRLADYEDAEEQGLLLRLPVKSGDTVYQLRDKKHALGVGVHPRHISRVCVYGNDWIAEHQGDKPCTKNDFGKTWFLTRKEAEAALAKDTNVPDKEEHDGRN